MSDSNAILASHHVIERSTFRKSLLLNELVKHKLIDQDVSANRIYLPVEGGLADRLEVSPHRGRTVSSYTKVVNGLLDEIQNSPDGRAAIRADSAALKRVAAEVRDLQDTLKVALENGDLYATRPDHLTTTEMKAQNNT
ncbi:AHH domain-containing protein [Xanthomonas translucens]|uniref:AHH domain-containing protein n=1 Tax=Xanthomonas campestris pv. translucens TaxID=343 RepID=UPI001F26B904|nr:AHH domain-containing protein [Xanthomonas translucens]UKE51180.1 AHH domain-containing protein [Xanthomonas translucens]